MRKSSTPTVCMRLEMRRPRLPRLYPLKSNPPAVRRYSRSSSSPVSAPASVPSGIDVDAHVVDRAQVDDRLAYEAGAAAGVGRFALEAAGAVIAAEVCHPAADPARQVSALLESDDRAPQGGLECLALVGEQA